MKNLTESIKGILIGVLVVVFASVGGAIAAGIRTENLNVTGNATIAGQITALGGNSSNWNTAYTHTSNTSNPHAVTKAQVGLTNASDTADADKPVSTAQQSALNLKGNLSGGNSWEGNQTVNGTVAVTPSSPAAGVIRLWNAANTFWNDITSGNQASNITTYFPATGGTLALRQTAGEYNTTQITEGTNLYYTDARARAALSATGTGISYNQTSGVITGTAGVSGSNTWVQYNDNGTLGSSPNFYWNNVTNQLGVGSSGPGRVGFQSSSSNATYTFLQGGNVSVNHTYIMPETNGTTGQIPYLMNATSGQLGWKDDNTTAGSSTDEIILGQLDTSLSPVIFGARTKNATITLDKVVLLTNATGSNINVTFYKGGAFNDVGTANDVALFTVSSWTNGTSCSYNNTTSFDNATVEADRPLIVRYNSGTNTTMAGFIRFH